MSILAVLVAILAAGAALSAPTGRPRPDGAVHASACSPDTVRAGDVYITLLPDTLGGTNVRSWESIRPPLRSWLKGRSFFWRTTGSDVGTHLLGFLADTGEPQPDSFQVEIVVLE